MDQDQIARGDGVHQAGVDRCGKSAHDDVRGRPQPDEKGGEQPDRAVADHEHAAADWRIHLLQPAHDDGGGLDERRIHERDTSVQAMDSSGRNENLVSGAPRLWVALRPTEVEPPYEVFGVTADPAEGEAWTQSGGDLVDVVPMPDDVRATIDAFFAEHHVERPFYKRKRDRADPEAFARREPATKERE